MMSYKADHSVKWRFSILGVLAGLALLAMTPAKAEYADVIINNYADAAGMRPVVFPHWFHRIRFRCKVCHADLGFQFKTNGNKITMAKNNDKKNNNTNQNDKDAKTKKNNKKRHSGIPGTPTHIHGS